MTQQRNSRKANGHPGPNGRPNGRGPACAPASSAGKERGGLAASDGASGVSVAIAAAIPAVTDLQMQASTGREACAEVAPPPPNANAQRMSAANAAGGDKDKPEREVPPGKDPLPDNPTEFVEEIHRKIDLTEVWHELLRSKDEKVKQRAVEKLTGMLYEDGSISAEESQQIVWDIDSAVARRAATARQKEPGNE